MRARARVDPRLGEVTMPDASPSSERPSSADDASSLARDPEAPAAQRQDQRQQRAREQEARPGGEEAGSVRTETLIATYVEPQTR
jgi:hypothetical protein